MKYLGLQAGRGIAACLVVLHHISGKLATAHPETPLFLGGFFDFGWVGVDFFFVLSGFIIAHTLRTRPTAGDFLLRRLVRIYPPFWIAFGVTLGVSLMLPAFRGALQNFAPIEWGLALGLLPSGHGAPVIGVAWTLHHEVFFYAMAGLWLLAPSAVAATAALLLAIPLWAPQADFPGSFLTSPLHWEFVFGIGAWWLHRRLTARVAQGVVVAGLAWIAASCALLTPINDAEGRLRVLQFGMGFGLLTLGVAAAEYQRWLSGQQSHGPLVRFGERLGEWSFALYLLHIPIILATLKVFSASPLTGLSLLYASGLIAFALSLACAAVYYSAVERPLLKKLLAARGPHLPNRLEA